MTGVQTCALPIFVFEHGNDIVKASTVVPYQPANSFYKTPEQAIENARNVVGAMKAMKAAGVTGIPKTSVRQVGDKIFTVTPKLHIPEKFTAEQLQEIRGHLKSLHDAGYAVNDEIQMGVGDDGKLYHYDLGKAQHYPSEKDRKWYQEGDEHRMQSLHSRSGVDYHLPLADVRRGVEDAKRILESAAKRRPLKDSDFDNHVGRLQAALYHHDQDEEALGLFDWWDALREKSNATRVEQPARYGLERYNRSSELAAKLERMGLKPTPGMVSAFEKAYERRKLKDMGLPIPQHLSQSRPFAEVLAETPAAKAQAAKEAEKQAKQAAKQATRDAKAQKAAEPIVSVATKPKRQPGDGTPGWQRVGGAPVFVDGNGKITKGCPGLKGEHVSDLIDESDESRKRREVRNDHALAMGKTGEHFTPSQLKKLEVGRNRERHEAAEKAAKKAGVPTHKVLSQMPEIEKTARAMGVKRADAAESLGDALRAIGDQYEIERMNAKEVAKAHRHAMRMTGLTPAKIHKLEDSGKDHTAVKGFDVNAYTFAAENESPFVHFDKHSGDIEHQVWEFIKNGKPEKATLSKIASNAADMLANNIKNRLRKAGIAVAPAEDHSDEWAAMERGSQPATQERFAGDEDEVPEHHKHASGDDEPFDKFSRRAGLSITRRLA